MHREDPTAASVEAQVIQAFRGVTREGGYSWSQARVRDDFGTPDELAGAAEEDRDERWEDLISDPAWKDDAGVGGFSFLGTIGARYYLAPAMIRSLRRGHTGECSCLLMSLHRPQNFGMLTPRQRAAVIAFLEHFAAADETRTGTAWAALRAWRAWREWP